MKNIDSINTNNLSVLLRADFNVPIDNKKITDDTKLIETLKTIRWLKNNGSKIIICSHLGRPKGYYNSELSIEIITKYLEQLLKIKIIRMYTKNIFDNETLKKIKNLDKGEIGILENIRFFPEEEENDDIFSKSLSQPFDIYVNDAFGASHRSHSSIDGITKYLPSYAGFLMQKEIRSLKSILTNPESPFISIIGGAKVSDKIRVLEKLASLCDFILIGGGMVKSFLYASGYLRDSNNENVNDVIIAKKLLSTFKNIKLPSDVITTKQFSNNSKYKITKIEKINNDDFIMDIGPRTIEEYKKVIIKANTILWNGPLGVYEFNNFSNGTFLTAMNISKNKGTTIAGGGSTGEVIKNLGLRTKISHVSTGGGATLEYLEGKSLPGVERLR